MMKYPLKGGEKIYLVFLNVEVMIVTKKFKDILKIIKKNGMNG